MTDREMLEKAAKAANNGACWYRDLGMCIDAGGPIPIPWRPRDDDVDAMRLAVDLGLTVQPYPIYDMPKTAVIVKRRRRGDIMREANPTEVVEQYGADPRAATRLAIVRCAAACEKHASLWTAQDGSTAATPHSDTEG